MYRTYRRSTSKYCDRVLHCSYHYPSISSTSQYFVIPQMPLFALCGATSLVRFHSTTTLSDTLSLSVPISVSFLGLISMIYFPFLDPVSFVLLLSHFVCLSRCVSECIVEAHELNFTICGCDCAAVILIPIPDRHIPVRWVFVIACLDHVKHHVTQAQIKFLMGAASDMVMGNHVQHTIIVLAKRSCMAFR